MTRYLPIGHTIQDPDHSGAYTIKGILGHGASTITYLTDYSDGAGHASERIIKEYYPASLNLMRDDCGNLEYSEESAGKFDEGMARYKRGGILQNDLRKKACLKNETPPLQRIFYVNRTCYLDVVPFEGRTFDKFESFTLLERLRVCVAVSKLISQYHKEGYLYLDLKPENIFVLTNSSGEVVTDMVVLIDFDSVTTKKDVSFGKSLSFTKAWAAPEQRNPHAFRKISEATDIYAIGELVFWSVFNRHSTEAEHRSFSVYPFENNIRYTVQKSLSHLFRNTIRSSARNRFADVDRLVPLLCQIIQEQEKTVYLRDSIIRRKPFFVGRGSELDDIHTALEYTGIVFVYGMGGIGKSEIAKAYFDLHKAEYDNVQYWFYSGSFADLLCDDRMVYVHGINREKDENDDEYCRRKLRAIKDTLPSKSLIIIDNVNTAISNLSSNDLEIWKELESLSCDIIVTTRCKQEAPMIHIKELESIDLLRHFFFQQEQVYSDDQLPYIDKIIESLNRHTLLIELIARQMVTSKWTPQRTFAEITHSGLSRFPSEAITLSKDDRLVETTLINHINSLFSLAMISEDQKLLLSKLAFMPLYGVDAESFAVYFAMDNHNVLNSLISNGWISQSTDGQYVLSVHPLVASVAKSFIRDNTDFCKMLQSEIAAATTKWIDTFSGESECNNMGLKLSYGDFLSIYRSIAFGYFRSDIRTIASAELITQYAEWSYQYGELSTKCNMMIFATSIYDDLVGTEQFSSDKERAFDTYYSLLIAQPNADFAYISAMCSNRRVVCRKAKNAVWSTYWFLNQMKVTVSQPWRKLVSLLFPGLIDFMRLMLSNTVQTTEKAKSLFIRDAELMEALISAGKIRATWLKRILLQFAIWERKYALKSHHENASANTGRAIVEQTDICEARMWLLSGNKEEARALLERVARANTHKHYTINLYEAQKLLGSIALSEQDYNEVTMLYQSCLAIEEALFLPRDLSIADTLTRLNKKE